jgi:glycolate oxidase FAD binding subunit
MTGGGVSEGVRGEVRRLLPSALVPTQVPGFAGRPGAEPPVMVLPGTAAEAATILALASARNWPVRLAGPGGGGSVPGRPDDHPVLVMRSDRLAAVAEYEPADLTVTVGAGMTLGELDGIVRGRGQWLPLDPPGWPDRSVGGLVATGASGPLRAGFGTTRDHVLGATLVTGDGRVLELGGRVVKNVAGFDLLRLAVGSGGTLGFLAGVTLRLHPLPRSDRTLLFHPAPREAGAVARRLALLPAPVAALEWLGGGFPGATEGSTTKGGEPVLALRLVGGEAEVASVTRRAVDAAGVAPSDVLEGPASEAFFLQLSGVPCPEGTAIRISLLPALLPEVLERTLSALGKGGARWFAAHVTAGVVRLQVGRDLAPAALREVSEWVRAREGSIRGPGVPPARERQERLTVLEGGLRSVFDPSGILLGIPGVGA